MVNAIRKDPVIEFAQSLFGSDAEPSIDAAGRTVPPWLDARETTATVLEDGDEIAIEGEVPGASETDDAAPDGSTPDDLAFYLPFHFYKVNWGIYIRASGIRSLARRLAARSLDLSSLMAAYLVLLDHERQHFSVEYACSRIEVVTARSAYREYFRDRRANEHEEALANARAMKELRRFADARTVAALEAWMLN